VSEAIVPNRLGKAEEAPRRVWMGEGRNENGARELAESPDDRTRAPRGLRGHQSTRSPICRRQGEREGNHQSSRRVVKRATARGSFRRASVRRDSHADRLARGAEKHAGQQRTAHAVRARSARAGHRSDWVLVRGSRSVEVDETCLSGPSGRACADAEGRDSAGCSGVDAKGSSESGSSGVTR
jgi:hypothetical protein